ncbi:MAG TPA: flagellar motor protein PomA [Pelagibacterium sp.]|uniref:motility protein A n=1 Tax=uncultured Pelagibacterium sp. TaxID=1159875 RepID=UPI000C44B6BB|nr:flagellar motor protein PomA [Pelagibacterium sp.]HCO54836.1 flagellar motor protein PomA [Pelagibacterium sp.]|tara:strand:- start:896 stop:1675 length:780 start_codon:yes stop_codon:yes gene_type:complete
MDLATILGIIAGAAVIAFAIFMGGSFSAFVDIPSIFIVIGGGFAATLIRFPLAGVGQALVTGGRVAFTHKKVEPRELIEKIARMGDIARRQGPLGLEGMDFDEPNLRKGAQYIADAYDPDFIRESMELERDQYLSRLSEGQRVFKSLGDAAPAFGMIGTLVGLVQMLGSMDDPSAIGPAMAVALLTTLYGAIIANLVCLPISDKLLAKFSVEEINQTLIIDGIMSIRDGKSPNLIREMLVAYLPEQQREADESQLRAAA